MEKDVFERIEAGNRALWALLTADKPDLAAISKQLDANSWIGRLTLAALEQENGTERPTA